MAFYLKKNNAKTIIDMVGGFNAGSTSLVVKDASVFPTTGNFIVTIWDKVSNPDPSDDDSMEIVKCTSVSGNTLTVVRAQESTSNIKHNNLDAVEMLITAGQLEDVESKIFETIDVVGTSIQSSSALSTLNIRTGSGISVIANNSTKTITISGFNSETDPLSWLSATAQTGLTGNKTGSFNLTTTGKVTTGLLREVNSGTIVRVNDLISTITIGSVTNTYTRNASGFVTGKADGTNTWTYTRDVNNNITGWSVA